MCALARTLCKGCLRENQRIALCDSVMAETNSTTGIPAGYSPTQASRIVRQCWGLMLLLVAAVIWRPLAAYPGSGRWLWLLWGLFMLTAVLLRNRMEGKSVRIGLGGGLLFGIALFAWGRWALAGLPFAGSDGITTLFAAVIAGIAAHELVGAAKAADPAERLPEELLGFLLVAFALGGLVCGLHAMAQRWFIYDRMYVELLRDLAGAPPDALQAGLLHHFKLKRVASVWGDPNALGAFLALGFLASVALVTLRGLTARRWPVMVLSVAAGACSLVGIGFSGSRGAILDLVVGLLVLALGLWWKRREGQPAALKKVALSATVLLLGLSLTGQTVTAEHQAGQTSSTAPLLEPPSSGWKSVFSRSDTIRERVYYAQIGWRIFSTSPIVGAGPGAVDQLYARYKPVEARESKYLHNYILQIGAEYGLIGLMLALLGVAGLCVSGARLVRRGGVPEIAVVAMTAMLLADGLYQLSFNQRELMIIFGILAGTLIATSRSSIRSESGPQGRLVLIGSILIFALGMQAGFAMLTSLHARRQAEAAFDDGQPEKAIGLLHRARRWAPRDPQSFTLEANITAPVKGIDAGLPLIGYAITLQPASASLRSMMGDFLERGGRPEEAIRFVRQAVDLYPSKADYHHQLAQLLAETGAINEAVEQAQMAVKLAYLFEGRYEASLEKLLKLQQASRAINSAQETSGSLTDK